MVKKIISVMFLALLIACSVSGNLSHKYEGKGIETLYKELGTPKTISNIDNGNKLYEFEKQTFIKSTEIGSGRNNTLDPRLSPSYMKVETYLFEVDKNGIIVNTDYQKKIDK